MVEKAWRYCVVLLFKKGRMGYKAHWCWLFAFMDVLFILAISLTCFCMLDSTRTAFSLHVNL